MSRFNNWGVSYSSIIFFEEALNTHNKVKNVVRNKDIFFKIENCNNKVLNTLLLDEYRFGIAALMKALDEFSDAKYIVIGGNWNEATSEALKYAEDNKIGIFTFSEFFGAINYKEPLNYLKRNERKSKKDPFKSA